MDVRSTSAQRSLGSLFLGYLSSTGYNAVVRYRIATWLRGKRIPGSRLLARRLLRRLSMYPGVEINCQEDIGVGFRVAHAHDIVIGTGTRIGRNVTLYNGVTLGARRYKDMEAGEHDNSRYPTIEDGVTIFSGAKVLGPVTIGKNSIVGANSVVLESFPEESVIAGVPARFIRGPKVPPKE
jgi:serine O-acetyltransferase